MDINKHIPEIEKKINYVFSDRSLLLQAFTRTSFCNEHNQRGKEDYSSNEILEFFGDSVLSTAIVSIMLTEKARRYEHGISCQLDEGDLSIIRSKLSDKRNLSGSMAKLGLHKYLIMGEGDEKMGIANEPSVMEDLFESIIGAVYIDCGMNMETVIGSVRAMLDLSHYRKSEDAVQNPKNALQEWCADKQRRLAQPSYKTVRESGPDHKKEYERLCFIGDTPYGRGVAKNCKLADIAAAEETLRMLREEESKNRHTVLDPAEIMQKLKAAAAKNKLPSPEFKDLGESANSNEKAREYVVECRMMGRSVSACGVSKQDARVLAAAEMLELITDGQATANRSNAKTGAKRKKAKKVAPVSQKTENESKITENPSKSAGKSKKANAKAAKKANKQTNDPTSRQEIPAPVLQKDAKDSTSATAKRRRLPSHREAKKQDGNTSGVPTAKTKRKAKPAQGSKAKSK